MAFFFFFQQPHIKALEGGAPKREELAAHVKVDGPVLVGVPRDEGETPHADVQVGAASIEVILFFPRRHGQDLGANGDEVLGPPTLRVQAE